MPYSIYKNNYSGGYHLHQASNYGGICTPDDASICKKSYRTGSSLVSSCLTASEARHKTADIGEPFCGTCVSHLYKNY